MDRLIFTSRHVSGMNLLVVTSHALILISQAYIVTRFPHYPSAATKEATIQAYNLCYRMALCNVEEIAFAVPVTSHSVAWIQFTVADLLHKIR